MKSEKAEEAVVLLGDIPIYISGLLHCSPAPQTLGSCMGVLGHTHTHTCLHSSQACMLGPAMMQPATQRCACSACMPAAEQHDHR
mmetsp:Transcript_72715/g.122440  ORF Transcript_72715/g.122440 Transcript_72715/m.122440 type:complete len:85 (-) Transcript_72715:131-385(-)